MLAYFLIFIIRILSILLPLIRQPLSFGLVLLVTTLISAILTSALSLPWYGYMLFLIFIGGLLVIFAYIAALAPNSYFKPPKIIFSLIILTFIYIVLAFNHIYVISPSFSNQHFNRTMKLSYIIYSLPLSPTLFFLIYILLITIISVAKICSFRIGPLRPYK